MATSSTAAAGARAHRSGTPPSGSSGRVVRAARVRVEVVGVADVEVRGTVAVVQAATRTRDDGGGGGLPWGVRDDAGANHCGAQSATTSTAACTGWRRPVRAGGAAVTGGHGRPRALAAACSRPGVVADGFLHSPSSALHVWRPMEGARGFGVCWWRRGGAMGRAGSLLVDVLRRWRGAGYVREAAWCKSGESLHRRSVGGHDGGTLVVSVSPLGASW
jgi:hypothetical protein